MPRKGENIYKRKDGRWEGRFIKEYGVNRKALYGYVYGKTYNEVRQKLRKAQVKELSPQLPSNQSATTYNDLLKLWLASVRINVKESTYARYYQLVSTHISPTLGKYDIEKIGTPMIEHYIGSLLKNGRLDGTGGLSAKSVSDILTIIKSSFAYAKDNDYAVRCKIEKVSVKKPTPDMRVLSASEQSALKEFLLCDMDLSQFGVLLSLYTGIRIGELCALRWEHLKLDAGILEVRETMQRVKNLSNSEDTKTRIIITEPKSECSVRDIPLPQFIIEIARQFESAPETFVLTGSPNTFIEPRTLQYRFQKYIQACGIKDANYHSMRHTFATRCIEIGFDIKSLSEILGHANVNITLNRYVHSSFELKKQNMLKLDSL